MLTNWNNYPEIQVVDTRDTGHWRVIVYTDDGAVDISLVRGITTMIDSITFTDPFGPAAAELRFPGLSALDALGEGDLQWWRAGNGVDIVWEAFDAKALLLRSEVRWEGYIAGESVSFADDGGSIRMTLKGALLEANNTIVMPEYPQRPWPFEHAIGHALDKCRENGARFKKMLIKFPDNWDITYTKGPDDPWWMQPLMVESGQQWSGMVTRDTGQFNPALSGYVESLLTSMHTQTGQFTLNLNKGRVPVLEHRLRVGRAPDAYIDIVTPGVGLELTCDYETKTNVVFGKGRGMDGISFSNMQYDIKGTTAYYLPFSSHQTVYPHNQDEFKTRRKSVRRDISLTFVEGMSHSEATKMAELYRQRFAQAGYAGTMTLTTDPYIKTTEGDITIPRHTLRAGDAIRVLHFQGRDTGVTFNITEATHNIDANTTSLTIDTVFRDHLTTDEVRLRGRDALTQSPSLITGQYSPNIRDQMLPWGPESGYIPVASKSLYVSYEDPRFDQAVPDLTFPWTTLTVEHPPKDVRWTAGYIKIPAATNDLQKNWNNPNRSTNTTAIVQLSQAGSIALFQMMAVDADGQRMRVPFHVSFYLNTGVVASDMPLMDNTTFTHPLFPTLADTSMRNPPYPFFPNAWEKWNADGSTPGTDTQRREPAPGADPISNGTFGTPKQPAGYFPGTPPVDWMSTTPPVPTGDKPTGLISVENPFSYDVSQVQKNFNPHDPTKNDFDTTGIAGVMIYCDSMWSDTAGKLVIRNKDVYFIGRLFRTPPGTG